MIGLLYYVMCVVSAHMSACSNKMFSLLLSIVCDLKKNIYANVIWSVFYYKCRYVYTERAGIFCTIFCFIMICFCYYVCNV